MKAGILAFRLLMIPVLIPVLLLSAVVAEADEPITWTAGDLDGWQVAEEASFAAGDEGSYLSVIAPWLALQFPAGSGQPTSVATPAELAFMATTNASQGRLTGDVRSASQLFFRFDAQKVPAGNQIKVQLFNNSVATNPLLFEASVEVRQGQQDVVVPLTMPPFQLYRSLTNRFEPPYTQPFEDTLSDVRVVYIRVPRNNSAGTAPAETYRIVNLEWQGSGSATAQVSLLDLERVYDGMPQEVAVETVPTGLVVEVRYDGALTAPVDAGTYEVVATVTEPGYTGAVTNQLVIQPASATLQWDGALERLANGAPQALSVVTDPDPALGAGVEVRYDGALTPPVTAGVYAVEAQLTNSNYQAAAITGVLTVADSRVELELPLATAENRVLSVPLWLEQEGGATQAAVRVDFSNAFLLAEGYAPATNLQGQAWLAEGAVWVTNQVAMSGRVQLGTLTLRTRSVPTDGTTVVVQPQVTQLWDGAGDGRTNLVGLAEEAATTVAWRAMPGDANNNGRIDVGDAVLLYRWVQQPALWAERPWEVALNEIDNPLEPDLNLADVQRALRVVTGEQAPPTFFETEPEPFVQRDGDGVTVANQSLLLDLRVEQVGGTQLLVRVLAPESAGPLGGASFALAYPAAFLQGPAVSFAPTGTVMEQRMFDAGGETGSVVQVAAVWDAPWQTNAAFCTVQFAVSNPALAAVHYPLDLLTGEVAAFADLVPPDPQPVAAQQVLVQRPFADWVAAVTQGAAVGPEDPVPGKQTTYGEEYAAGTDPGNTNDVLMVAASRPAATNAPVLQWYGHLGVRYQPRVVEDLLDEWVPLGPAQVGRDAMLQAVDDAGEAAAARFYKITVEGSASEGGDE